MTFVTAEPYIGHLGLDGVGDTKGLLESEMRQRHIRFITNAKVDKFEESKAFVSEIADDGSVRQSHEILFVYTMMLPALRGVPAVHGIEGLTNPRGLILADQYQRNPTFKDVFSIGVCVAIPPVGKTPVPVGVPKTRFMIESMVTATAQNIASLIVGKEPKAFPTCEQGSAPHGHCRCPRRRSRRVARVCASAYLCHLSRSTDAAAQASHL